MGTNVACLHHPKFLMHPLGNAAQPKQKQKSLVHLQHLHVLGSSIKST